MKTPIKKILHIVCGAPLVLGALMLVMFYLRVAPIHDSVFTNWPGIHGNYVNFATDDAVYHMRLVHNTVKHFPFRIFFDPFTNFPYGNQIHFGPLYTLLIAGIALLLGGGHPSDTLINTVGAYVPPILASLCIIPIYYIGKKIFNKNVGVFAALILAFLPGEFFHRSTLGFADHHIAEVLFSTLTLAFLVYAIAEATALQKDDKELTNIYLPIYNKEHSNKTINKSVTCFSWIPTFAGMTKMFLYAVFAGISFGLYLLTWPAALLVGGILFIFFIAQLITDLSHKRNPRYLLAISAIVYLIPLALVLPYSLGNPRIQLDYYSLIQPIVLALFFIIFWCMYGISKILDKHSILNKKIMIYAPFILIASAFLFIYLFSPTLFNTIIEGLKLLFAPKPGMLTVSEVWPSILDRDTASLTFSTLHSHFFLALPMGIVAIFALANGIWKRGNPNEILLFIWSVVMIAAMVAQVRFGYYAAISIALLAGFFADELFSYFSWLLFSTDTFKHTFVKTTIFGICVAAFTVQLIYPYTVKENSIVPYGTRLSREWYDTLMWLNKHTPDPRGRNLLDPRLCNSIHKCGDDMRSNSINKCGDDMRSNSINKSGNDMRNNGMHKCAPMSSQRLWIALHKQGSGKQIADIVDDIKNFNYTSGFYPIPKKANIKYNYPSSAYGIMNWWDNGHQITYIAERIPNSNPFQKGIIILNNGLFGAAPFFTSENEDNAITNLDNVGTKYVVIQNRTANTQYKAMLIWQGKDNKEYEYRKLNISYTNSRKPQTLNIPVDSPAFNKSMLKRLYYEDGNGLSHIRLVHESEGEYIVNLKAINVKTRDISPYEKMTNKNYGAMLQFSNSAKIPRWLDKNKKFVIYDAKPPVKEAKIFEKVKGAVIAGLDDHANYNKYAYLSITLLTNNGRLFVYKQKTEIIKGLYKFIVPYPTEPMKGDGYDYDIVPLGKYILTIGNKTKYIDVSEKDVIHGEVVKTQNAT